MKMVESNVTEPKEEKEIDASIIYAKPAFIFKVAVRTPTQEEIEGVVEDKEELSEDRKNDIIERWVKNIAQNKIREQNRVFDTSGNAEVVSKTMRYGRDVLIVRVSYSWG